MKQVKKRIYSNKAAFGIRDAECMTKCMAFIGSELETIGTDARFAFRSLLLKWGCPDDSDSAKAAMQDKER